MTDPRQGSPGGRSAQRERTRRELLAGARALLDAGSIPNVNDVAAHTGISRTTAYRYFASQEVLLMQAAVQPILDEIEAAVEAADGVTEPIARVDAVFARAAPAMLARMAQLRAMFRATFDRSTAAAPVRDAFLHDPDWARTWRRLLEPLRDAVSPERYALMTTMLSVLLGLQSLMAAEDACDGDVERAAAALRTTARALITGFLRTPE